MSGRTYVCEGCRGTFNVSEERDAAAHAEAEALWGRRGDAPDMAIVCDDCFKAIMDDVQTSAQKES